MFDALFPKGVHRAYFKSTYLGGLDDAMIDEIAPRCSDRPSDLPLCSVWYIGAATARLAGDASAVGALAIDWMLCPSAGLVEVGGVGDGLAGAGGAAR